MADLQWAIREHLLEEVTHLRHAEPWEQDRALRRGGLSTPGAGWAEALLRG